MDESRSTAEHQEVESQTPEGAREADDAREVQPVDSAGAPEAAAPEIVDDGADQIDFSQFPAPEEEDTNMDVAPLELSLDDTADKPVASGARDWYILKVQSNREESIKDALLRRINIEGLGDFFGELIVPTEMVTEFKGGKKRVLKRKLYPGYLVVHMELTEETWYLVRDTHGIGDFTGSGGKPSPMSPQEVARIVTKQEEKTDEQPKLKISFNTGDRVKIREGTFENFEGDVDTIDEANGRVTVMINIFGRSTPVELEYWQIESL